MGKTTIQIDAKAFAAGANTAINQMQGAVEQRMEAIGNEMTAATKAAWPLGPGRHGHTRDNITGTARRTKAGRFVYDVKVPFPGLFREFGTKHQPPRPVLRPNRAKAAAKIASL